MRFGGCFFQVSLFIFILFLPGGLADGQESNSGTAAPEPDRIVVISRDVGGGNFFNPNAKISVKVIGRDASEIKLFSVTSDGVATDLQSFPCQDGSRINFHTKYHRGQTDIMEIHLYDRQGTSLTFTKWKVN